MNTFALRLHPKQDIKQALVQCIKENNIKAGFILTCVGSLERATLRMADEKVKDFQGPFEIVSLVGTLSQDGVHLHLSCSDKDGKTVGGHVKEACLVHTTAEIVIGELKDLTFSRTFDSKTGFKELVISGRE